MEDPTKVSENTYYFLSQMIKTLTKKASLKPLALTGTEASSKKVFQSGGPKRHLASRAMHPLGGPLAMATPLHSFPPMGPQNTRLDVEDTSPLPPMSSHLLSPPAEVHQVGHF